LAIKVGLGLQDSIGQYFHGQCVDSISNYFFAYNGPSWSISTEFFFYLVFPILIYQWEKSWQIKLLASGLIVVALISLSNFMKLPSYISINDKAITSSALLYINPLSRIFEFTFGACVALHWKKQASKSQWGISRGTLYEIVMILLAGVFMSTYFINPLTNYVGTTWAGPATSAWLKSSGSMFAFGLLIYVMAMGRGRISAWLSHPILVLLGEISFSIYLLHKILLDFYIGNIHRFPVLPNMLSLAIYWTTILLASYVMWSLIEMPCRRLMLGSREKNMHGTEVMKESWQSNIHLYRRTLSAAIILFSLVTTFYFLWGNNPNRISEEEAATMTPNNLKSFVGTRFGNLFELRGVRLERTKDGIYIHLAWENLIEQNLTYSTGVFTTDVDGNILVNINAPQPITRTAEKEGARWEQTTLIPSDYLTNTERNLAIVVYEGNSDPLFVDRGDRDWGNRRLLIDLRGDVILPKSHPLSWLDYK
jgi:peptidoglycan/LPS O-acetylase OafA/YrhL